MPQRPAMGLTRLGGGAPWPRTAIAVLFVLTAPAALARADQGSGGTPLTPAQVKRDFRVLRSALVTLHPGLYRYQSVARFDSAIAREERALARGASRADVYLAVARLAAQVRCGHTFINPANQSESVRRDVLDRADKLPLHVAIVGSRILVTASAADSVRTGDELVAIDGNPAQAILGELLAYARTDGGNVASRVSHLGHSGGRSLLDDVYPCLHPPADARYLLSLRDRGGRSRQVRVAGMTMEEREAKLSRSGGPAAEAWTFEVQNGVAVWRLSTFAFWNQPFDWKSEISRRFAQLEREKIPALVLDLRDNEGGDESIADSLLAHLVHGPAVLAGQRAEGCYERVPYGLARFLQTWDYDFFDRTGKVAPTGGRNVVLVMRDSSDRIVTPARPYRGRVFALIGPRNSSATFLLARALKETRSATLVGQATGGNQRGINGSEIAWVTLPESGVALDIPLVAWMARRPVPDGGIQPDVVVERRFEDAAAGVDAELAAVRQLMKR